MSFPKPSRVKSRENLDAVKLRPCLACGAFPTDPAHVKSVKSGGPDELWNLIPLCRKHHVIQHANGFSGLIKIYPRVWHYLESVGWEVLNGKLWNPKLSPRA